MFNRIIVLFLFSVLSACSSDNDKAPPSKTLNSAPKIAALADISIEEGATTTVTASASDADGDALTYTWQVPSGLSISGSGKTIELTADLITENSTYTVILNVSDQNTTTSTSFTVSVVNLNVAPEIDTIENVFLNEGATRIITASASDADGDTLTYFWHVPNGITITGDGETVELTADLVAATTDYTIVLEVSDQSTISSTSFKVTVVNLNVAPEIDTIETVSLNEGATRIITASASDADGDTLTYFWHVPDGITITGDGNTVELTADYISVDTNYTVTLDVQDQQSSTSASFIVSVANVNTPPTLEPVNTVSLIAGKSKTIAIDAFDAESDTLSYTWSVPEGLQANSNGNQISLTASPLAEEGTYTVSVTVSDSKETSNLTFDINVIEHLFSITVDEQPKAGRPATITLVSNVGELVSSIINIDHVLQSTVNQVDAYTAEVVFPVVYMEESVTYSVSATNEFGDTETIYDQFTLSINTKPKLQEAEETFVSIEDGTYLFEFDWRFSDVDGIASYELIANRPEIEISQINASRFSVKLDSLVPFEITMIATDAYGQSNSYTRNYDTPALSLPLEHAVSIRNGLSYIAQTSYAKIDTRGEIQSTEWLQVSGASIQFTETNKNSSRFIVNEYSNEPVVIQANVSLTTGEVHTVSKNIDVIEDLAVTFEDLPEDSENRIRSELTAIINTSENDILDINQDGIEDIITINDDIIELKIATGNGSYQTISNAGKLSYHQSTTRGYVRDDSDEPSYTIEGLTDIDGDAISDLIVEVSWPSNCEYCMGYTETLWVKGWVNAGQQKPFYFYGDYTIASGQGYGISKLIDFDGDGLKECLCYDGFDGSPYITAAKPDNTLSASYFSQHFDPSDLTNGYYKTSGDVIGSELIEVIISDRNGDIILTSLSPTRRVVERKRLLTGETLTSTTPLYVTDVDDDGKSDLIYYNNSLSVIKRIRF